MSLAGSLIWMLPVMTPPPVESAGLYSPPPVKKLSCCPAAAGGTRPLVPAADAVAPSYSGTEMMPLLTVRPSPMREDDTISDQEDQSLLAKRYCLRNIRSLADE